MSASSVNNNNSGKITLPDWFNDKKREEEVLSAIQNQKISSVPFILPTCKKFDISQNRELDLSSGMFINPLTLKEEKSSQHDGKFYLTDVGYFILKSFKGDLCSLGVVGPARKGKSYLLSKILNVKHAFRLGHTMNSETRGIWVGTQLAQGNDSKKIVCFDTEGINAHDTTTDNDNIIFVLTVLLTSTLVYNSSAVPSATDLDSMGFITSLVERIAIKATVDETGQEFPKYFPDMIWVLRDVLLETMIKGVGIVSPRDYLMQNVLKRSNSKTPVELSRNVTRECILSFFPSIDCKTVSPPTTDSEVLKDIENVSPSLLDQNFVKEIDQVISLLKEKSRPKMAGYGDEKKVVNGETLAYLAYSYVCAVNEPGAIPSVLSASEQAEEISINQTIETGISFYDKEMTTFIQNNLQSVDLFQLFEQHSVICKKIVKTFDDVFCINSNSIAKGVSKFYSFVGGMNGEKQVPNSCKFYKYMKENETNSMMQCEKVFNQLYQKFLSEITEDLSDVDFKRKVEQFKSQLERECKGPLKETFTSKFLTKIKNDEAVFEKSKLIKKEEMKLHLENEKLLILKMESEQKAEEAMKIAREEQQAAMEFAHKMMEQQEKKMDEMRIGWEKERREEANRIENLQQSMFQQVAEMEQERMTQQIALQREMQERFDENMKKSNEHMMAMQEQMTQILNTPPQVNQLPADNNGASIFSTICSTAVSLIGMLL